MIDSTFIYTSRQESVSKETYYTILEVKADRTREVLAIVNFPTESSKGWSEAFSPIKERGVKAIGLVVCDSLNEIETAVWQHYPKTEIQLCMVHLARSIEKHIKPKHKSEEASDLKEVFKAGDNRHTIDRTKKKWE